MSKRWRHKQLQYTWLKALMRYLDFESITRDSLRSALSENSLLYTRDKIEGLLAEYLTPDTFPDVKDALTKLRSRTRLSVVLSNGTSRMLSKAIKRANLSSMFELIISVDKIRTYKPSPACVRACYEGGGHLQQRKGPFRVS
jgi:2-haloacid dehalogenase